MPVSLFNDVIGPVMRGPSSGHTAATWRMGLMSAALAGRGTQEVECRFHKSGAYANVFRQQGSDMAFAAGFAGIAMTDERYTNALGILRQKTDLQFSTPELSGECHPNEVEVAVRFADRSEERYRFRSLGGGIAALVRINAFSVWHTGDSNALFYLAGREQADALAEFLGNAGATLSLSFDESFVLVHGAFTHSVPEGLRSIAALPVPVHSVYCLPACMFVPKTKGARSLLETMEAYEGAKTLAELAAEYECALLGISRQEADAYLADCAQIMLAACARGCGGGAMRLQVARPQAGSVLHALEQGAGLCGGVHAKAAAMAAAAAEWNASGGLVVAAPTAGSGGVLPAMLWLLQEEWHCDEEVLVKALWTAGAVGLAIAEAYTFAGGVGGCQVEIGSAGAMAAAALVECAQARSESAALCAKRAGSCAGHSGSARPAARSAALGAAAMFLQNSIGLACDPVRGFVEVPCIGRNAAAISHALLCADLALAGWTSPVSFSQTLLALKDAGTRLPPELRCTSRGGLAICDCTPG